MSKYPRYKPFTFDVFAPLILPKTPKDRYRTLGVVKEEVVRQNKLYDFYKIYREYFKPPYLDMVRDMYHLSCFDEGTFREFYRRLQELLKNNP